MNAGKDATSTLGSSITFVVLLAFAGALAVAVLRPGRASLWPANVEAWLSGARGPVGLDEPVRTR